MYMGSSSAGLGDADPVTAYGFLETTEDALLVVQATRQGICERIKRRLQQKEQHFIRSGSIFVYDEEEAGVSSWASPRGDPAFFLTHRTPAKFRTGTPCR